MRRRPIVSLDSNRCCTQARASSSFHQPLSACSDQNGSKGAASHPNALGLPKVAGVLQKGFVISRRGRTPAYQDRPEPTGSSALSRSISRRCRSR